MSRLLRTPLLQALAVGLALALASMACQTSSSPPAEPMAQQALESVMVATPEMMKEMTGETMMEKPPETMMGTMSEAMMGMPAEPMIEAAPGSTATSAALPTPAATVPAPTPAPAATATVPPPTSTPAPAVVLPNHLRSPHFVSSSPSHGQALSQIPESIAINFDFVLHDRSAMTVTRDGAAVQLTNRSIDASKLILRASIVGNPGGGVYVVNYKACWPDTSCHDGQFAFVVAA